MEPFTAGAPLLFKSELSQTVNSGIKPWTGGGAAYLMRTPAVLVTENTD